MEKKEPWGTEEKEDRQEILECQEEKVDYEYSDTVYTLEKEPFLLLPLKIAVNNMENIHFLICCNVTSSLVDVLLLILLILLIFIID